MYRTKSILLLAPIFFFTIVGISSFQNTHAQDADELSTLRVVGDAEISSGDIIADRDDNRDSNGNLTAGLRVVSDLTGLTFRSNNGILKIQQLPGANLLYLSTNERVVTIYKDGYPPYQLVLNDEGISLESGKVWEIKITGNQRSTTEPVQFEITPEDVVLFIDGEEFQVDGTVFDTELTTGDHFVQIRKDGYELLDDTLSVSAQTVNNPSYNLEQIDPINVLIDSDPQGASIYIDDRGGSEGNTPRRVNLMPGTRTIRLSLDGYSDITDEFELTEDTRELSYNLEKYVGFLTVNSTPENAILLIDGTRQTAKENLELTPGIKSLEIRAQGYDPQTRTVEIEQSDTLSIDIDLNQITGNIFFNIQQVDANVTLSRNGEVVREWKGPENFRDLPVGTYEIKAELNNFQTEVRTIELTRNAEESIDFDLIQIDGQGAFTLDGIFTEAEVSIEGPRFNRSYSQLPVNEASMPFGRYEITVEKPGFKDITKEVQINSLSQNITLVDEFEAKTKGKALVRSLFIPGLGHGYLGKGGRGFLYFLGSAAAIGWTVKSYIDYSDSYQTYLDALDSYNNAPAGSNFNSLRIEYEEAHQSALDVKDGITIGLIGFAAIKGIETLDLLLQPSNKKKLQEAKVQFNAQSNGISMRVNF